jgi:hypothetical protein
VKDVCVGEGIDDGCLLIESNGSGGKKYVLDEDGKFKNKCENLQLIVVADGICKWIKRYENGIQNESGDWLCGENCLLMKSSTLCLEEVNVEQDMMM